MKQPAKFDLPFLLAWLLFMSCIGCEIWLSLQSRDAVRISTQASALNQQALAAAAPKYERATATLTRDTHQTSEIMAEVGRLNAQNASLQKSVADDTSDSIAKRDSTVQANLDLIRQKLTAYKDFRMAHAADYAAVDATRREVNWLMATQMKLSVASVAASRLSIRNSHLQMLLDLGVFPLLALILRRSLLHRRAQRRRRDGLCCGCGYDLHSNMSGVCPECGVSITLAIPKGI